MARPTKLTPARQAKICEGLAAGMTREGAARRAGVGARTFYRWMAEGEDPEAGVRRQFRQAVIEAEDTLEHRCAEVLSDQLGTNNPEHIRQGAAKFLLERRIRGPWCKMTKVEATGADGGPLQVAASVDVRPVLSREALAAMTPEELRATLAGARDYLANDDDEPDDG